MNYDFESVLNRAHAPYSYSAKWNTEGPMAETIKRVNGFDVFPEDRLCFQVADMDFKCAPEIIEALIKTAEHGVFGYSVVPKEYFEAVSGWFRERFDWNFSTENIIIGSSGTHDLIADCVRSYTDPGDGVIVLLPSYNYHADIEPLRRRMIGVQMKNDNGYYSVDYDALEQACADVNNKLMIMMQPHNPTGRVFTEEEIKKIGDICCRHNVIIVSDEVHIDIARKGQKVLPVMKVLGDKGVISATAINKTFNAAGLAMSNLIIGDSYLKEKYQGKTFPMASPFGISAVIAAYTRCGPWVDALNMKLEENIDYVIERFSKELTKAIVRKPEGTYVLWVDFSGYGLSDEELGQKLRDTHIMLGDGTMFDAMNPRQFRRICLTSPRIQVEEMCDRLVKVFNEN